MIVTQKWRAPIAGQIGTVYRVQFGSQAEQVAYLRCMIEAYRGTQTIRQKAVDIVFGVYRLPSKALAAHAVALGDWVQKNIRYVNEGEETFQTPIQTLRLGYGDCDDHTTLICALVEAIGIPTQAVALGWNGGYRHIFPRAAARVGGRLRWIPLDSTLSAPMGTNPIARAVKDHGNVKVLAL